MRSFAEIYDLAAGRKGGAEALDALFPEPASPSALARITDDRWLSGMAKAVFRAGFNWNVVESKWPGIEAAFEGFDPQGVAFLSDESLETLLADRRVIRQWRKLKAIVANAAFVLDLAKAYGTAARYFADYPSTDYVGLLADIKARGAYLGGTSGQYFLREMGRDSFILSRDVLAALAREDVFSGSATSKSSLTSIQRAFNEWVTQGGRSLTRVSRVLAFSVG